MANDKKHHLIRQLFQSNPHTLDELIAWLQKEYYIERASFELLTRGEQLCFQTNVRQKAKECGLSECSDFEYMIYQVPNRIEGSTFDQKTVFVEIEKKTGYFWSNDNRLFLEGMLYLGVSEKDIQDNTLAFRTFLSYLYFYLDL